MNRAFKTLTTGILYAAVVALFAALATYLVSGLFGNLPKILLIVGLALLAAYVVADPDTVLGLFKTRGLKYGSNTVLMSVLFVAIIGAGNWFVNQHSPSFDLTANKIHTLSPQTISILKDLKQTVTVTGFFRAGEEQQAKDLLQLYAAQNSQIQYRIVDPEKDPATPRQLGIINLGTLVFQSGSNRKDVQSVTEQDFTSAILAVTSAERRKVYFVTGNGQPDPDDAQQQQGYNEAKIALQNNNYVVDALPATSSVPDDAAAVILASGTKPLLDNQKSAYADYLAKGGKMLVMSSAFSDVGDLNDLLKPLGLTFMQGITIDAANSLANNPQAPAVSRYSSAGAGSDITKGLTITLYPLAGGIQTATPAPQGITINAVASTSDQSWLQTHRDQIQFRDGDTRGPINLVVSASGKLPAPASSSPSASPSGSAPGTLIQNPTAVPTLPPASATPQASSSGAAQSAAPAATPTPIPAVTGADVNLAGGTRVVAVADTDWLSNQFLDFPQTGNRDLLVNTINYLAGNQALVSVPAKSTSPGQVLLLGSDANLILFTTALFIPLAVLVLGGFVWWQRR